MRCEEYVPRTLSVSRGVCVRHFKPSFPTVDIQHNPWACRFVNPIRDTRYVITNQRHRDTIPRFCILYCGYFLYSKDVACFDTADTPCLYSRGSVLPCSHYSQYLGLLSTRDSMAASTPILSGLGLRLVLEHLSVRKPLFYIELQETSTILEEYKLYVLCLTRPVTKKYGANLDLPRLLYFTNAANIELITASHLFRINCPLTTRTLFYLLWR